MPARKRRVPTKRHGTRNFILEALETTRSGPAVATAAIIRQVRKLAGKRLPEETIRSSLKTLVRQRVVKGRKSGHEKVYKLVAEGQTAAARPSPTPQSPIRAGDVPVRDLVFSTLRDAGPQTFERLRSAVSAAKGRSIHPNSVRRALSALRGAQKVLAVRGKGGVFRYALTSAKGSEAGRSPAARGLLARTRGATPGPFAELLPPTRPPRPAGVPRSSRTRTAPPTGSGTFEPYTVVLEPRHLRWFRAHDDIDIDATLRNLVNGVIAEVDRDGSSPWTAPTPVSSAPTSAPLPHRLSLGEVLVLEIGEDHLETATNVHGRVVLERHARPRE
ncbi:MAG: hypothetical protein KGJ23_13970 [Euryarchaeota archaeon]|nr:hypothetical protein [Euryarchaeota archaeon]MDE1837705.1 hypothetical protein [Euryarchaeota archaeon]MDE1881736.1 hypothetical protein [Euryarchaeota archaeon]MDE2045965.1 hypothetical protein [Thermoplasmata archaeon]